MTTSQAKFAIEFLIKHSTEQTIHQLRPGLDHLFKDQPNPYLSKLGPKPKPKPKRESPLQAATFSNSATKVKQYVTEIQAMAAKKDRRQQSKASKAIAAQDTMSKEGPLPEFGHQLPSSDINQGYIDTQQSPVTQPPTHHHPTTQSMQQQPIPHLPHLSGCGIPGCPVNAPHEPCAYGIKESKRPSFIKILQTKIKNGTATYKEAEKVQQFYGLHGVF